MKANISYTLALSLVVALVGCGSSDGSSTSVSNPIGHYVDSAVSGVSYSCGSLSGMTDATGAFSFENGEECTFSVGDVLLKKVTASQLKDGVEIVEDNVTVAAFLQTLDYDGNASNGIAILPDVVEALKTNNVTQVPEGDANLSTVVSYVSGSVSDYQGHIVTQTEALEHLKTTQKTVTTDILAGKTFYMVYDDAPGIFKVVINDDVSEVTVSTVDGSSPITSAATLDGDTLVYTNGRRIEISGYDSGALVAITHYSDGTSTKSYLFETFDEADAFATALTNATKEASGLMLVAPADPTSLDLETYNTLVFYKNTSFSKYNYFRDDSTKYAALLNTSVGCLDYGFTADEQVQDINQSGVLTQTYVDFSTGRTCIDSDYTNDVDTNVSGSMNFVVYYNK